MNELVVMRHARVVGGSPEPVDLVIAGGKVVAIGANLHGAAFFSEVIELEGRFVIPGIVDAHVHVTGGGGEAGFSSRLPRVTTAELVRAGVTTVVGVLGTDGTTRTARDLVATTLGLREEGLSAWCYTGHYGVPPATLTGSVRDDVVFIDPVIGVGELALSDHRGSHLTLNELIRIGTDVYVAGLTSGKRTVVHLHLGDGRRGLALLRAALDASELPPRLWFPTHLNRTRALWEEAKALARAVGDRGMRFDVTAFATPPRGGLSAAEAVLEWRDAGLNAAWLTISSDAGGSIPRFDSAGSVCGCGIGSPTTLLETVRTLVAAGLTLGEAVSFVSAHPAHALGLDQPAFGAKGRIAVGADADLVVLDETLTPWAVWARGRRLV